MINVIEQELRKYHVAEQGWRFTRLFAFTLIPQVAMLSSSHLTRSLILSVVVGAAETAFRQIYPVSTRKQIQQVVGTPTPVTAEPPAVQ